MGLQTILGANGTIGKVLAKEIAAYTDRIRLVSRNPKKVNETDELFATDLTEAGAVQKAIAGSEVVYLVVGFEYKLSVWQQEWPALMQATIDACKKYNAKLVFFDNIYLYDKNALANLTEEAPINPPSKKGTVRRDIAVMMMKEVNAGGLQGLIARAPDFYGPDNEKSVLIETVYKNLKKGKRPNWFMDADKKHSFIYTPDAAKATALLGNTRDAFNQVWHLPVDQNALTGNEMIALFNKAMQTDKKVQVAPMFLVKLMGIFMPFMREMPEMMYQYDRDYVFNSDKFNKRFDFQVTSYEEGVRQIVKA